MSTKSLHKTGSISVNAEGFNVGIPGRTTFLRGTPPFSFFFLVPFFFLLLFPIDGIGSIAVGSAFGLPLSFRLSGANFVMHPNNDFSVEPKRP